jgi:atypical dual specificity phosphatase
MYPGRAGTIAACYLVAFGFSRSNVDIIQPTMQSDQAIDTLRRLRPESIETSQQERFVSQWCSTIWKRQSLFPSSVPEPLPSPVEIQGQFDNTHDLVILVGLPGSGKSHFARSLASREPTKWRVVSQDDSGSRALCEAEVGRASTRLLLDRCNVKDRQEWISLASNWVRSPLCVWFDYPPHLCAYRAQNRPNHPTLVPGSRVRNAIKQMSNDFIPPSLQEGFRAIVTIRSFEAANELLSRMAPISLFKFPRTPHLLDLGAAAADDIILPPSLDLVIGNVVITEKVDGANLGISLSADGTQIIVQNRSHYVNSSSHEQFKKLGTCSSMVD